MMRFSRIIKSGGTNNEKHIWHYYYWISKRGYATKEAEDLTATFIEEQRVLDELRDSLHDLISE